MLQNQGPISIQEIQNLLVFIIMILEVSNKDHCKLDKILETSVSTITCNFQLFLSITQVYVAFLY